MTQGTFDFSGATAPVKLCGCGCGEPAPIATKNDRSNGRVKGQPMKFIRGHGSRVVPLPHKGAVRKLFVEEGQRLGRSTVIDPEVVLPPSRGGGRGVRLRCDCGREYVRKTTYLCSKPDDADESCGGCTPVDDLTGRQFGRLTVIRWEGTKSPDHNPDAKWVRRWVCECECGNEVRVTPGNLLPGRVQSCGCGKFGPKKGYVPGEAAFLSVLRGYQEGAKARGLSWCLSMEDFRRLTSLNCHYCGVAPSTVSSTSRRRDGVNYVYNGIDRVDNTRGYELDNARPACRQCNRSKMDLAYDDWMTWGVRFAAHLLAHPELIPEHLRPPQLKAA